ncbi:MAG: Peptidoglycan hydrolase FlgJ [Pseudomonadota bacterium]|jgi:Rod binding domain-containing protein
MADNTNPSTAAKSYSDFGALGELRGKAQRNDKTALRESAEQFEALFIQMMLKSMREANNVLKSDMFQSNALETFQGMYDKELSMSMAKRNALGFADVVVKQLSQQSSAPSTAELLALRQKAGSLLPTGMPLHKPVLPMSLTPVEQTPMPLPKQTLKPLPMNKTMPLSPVRNEP